MKNKFKILCAIAALTAILMVVGVVVAQGNETTDTPTETKAFNPVVIGQVTVSWVIYMLFGLLSSVTSKEAFDGKKFFYSFIIAMVVSVISIITGLAPNVIWQTNGDIISSAVKTLLESSAFLPLLYVLTKFIDIARAAWNRAQTVWKPPTG